MQKIGIIGAGQLGLYLGLAAHKMGFLPLYLDSNDKSPSSFITKDFICASFDDEDKVKELFEKSDVVTYEFENVNLDIIKNLEGTNKIPQGHMPLKISNDRLFEKNTAKDIGIPTPKFLQIDSLEDLEKGIEEIGFPCILKTRRFGYDGKGQYYLRNIDDTKKIVFDTAFILEEVIDFDFEISVIGIRSITKELAIYEPFLNIHKDGILHLTYTDFDLDEDVRKKAKSIVEEFLVSKDLYGILCCELFVKKGEIYFNELAPRPHNSGHITLDSHVTSQYENHLRSILGLPLGSTKIKKHGCMVNILGEDYCKIEGFYGEDTFIYDYRKGEPKDKRKMGHINYVGDDVLAFNKKVKELLR